MERVRKLRQLIEENKRTQIAIAFPKGRNRVDLCEPVLACEVQTEVKRNFDTMLIRNPEENPKKLQRLSKQQQDAGGYFDVHDPSIELVHHIQWKNGERQSYFCSKNSQREAQNGSSASVTKKAAPASLSPFHFLAQILIAERIEAGLPLSFHVKCDRCCQLVCLFSSRASLSAKKEVRYLCNERLKRLDVVIYERGRVAFVVEVLHSHRVEDGSRTGLQWGEVIAMHVIDAFERNISQIVCQPRPDIRIHHHFKGARTAANACESCIRRSAASHIAKNAREWCLRRARRRQWEREMIDKFVVRVLSRLNHRHRVRELARTFAMKLRLHASHRRRARRYWHNALIEVRVLLIVRRFGDVLVERLGVVRKRRAQLNWKKARLIYNYILFREILMAKFKETEKRCYWARHFLCRTEYGRRLYFLYWFKRAFTALLHSARLQIAYRVEMKRRRMEFLVYRFVRQYVYYHRSKIRERGMQRLKDAHALRVQRVRHTLSRRRMERAVQLCFDEKEQKLNAFRELYHDEFEPLPRDEALKHISSTVPCTVECARKAIHREGMLRRVLRLGKHSKGWVVSKSVVHRAHWSDLRMIFNRYR